ncbi:hypothetical protein ACFSWE_15415 [Leucobacter albus]|uniref:Uncharacterized protein n=1 Tax=Leucobacter albus TaxID=272210 RepID=A0ABW3TVJ5_9MICO
MRPKVAAVVALVLVALLAGCASLLPDTFTREVPQKLSDADIGVVGVDASTSWEGFSKVITVRVQFGPNPITDEQFRGTLVAVSEGLGVNAGAKLMLSFRGQEFEPAEGVVEATQTLNRELGLSGGEALDGSLSLLLFSSGKDLQALVTEMQNAGLL